MHKSQTNSNVFTLHVITQQTRRRCKSKDTSRKVLLLVLKQFLKKTYLKKKIHSAGLYIQDHLQLQNFNNFCSIICIILTRLEHSVGNKDKHRWSKPKISFYHFGQLNAPKEPIHIIMWLNYLKC